MSILIVHELVFGAYGMFLGFLLFLVGKNVRGDDCGVRSAECYAGTSGASPTRELEEQCKVGGFAL